ncbi:MAG: T9SS type A sorting domain-containing protein [Candidatus Kapabacteria bacterium]|nr:T9SS type A sorting domain-containing protein [Candidatus Kapabacteria bacterium]
MLAKEVVAQSSPQSIEPTSTVRTGRVQYIHASADPALSRVNVFISRGNAFSPLLRESRFGSATPLQSGIGTVMPLVDNVGGVTHSLYYTYGTDSTLTSSSAIIPFALASRNDNILISMGILQSRIFNFSPSPSQRSTVVRLLQIVDTTAPPDSSMRLIFVHGSTDAPRMEFVLRQTGQILTRLDFTQSSIATVPLGNYTIDVRTSTNQSVVASFGANFQDWNLRGQRITCVLSGFFNPRNNLDGRPLTIIAAPSSPVMLDSVSTAASFLLPEVEKPFVATFPRTRVQVIDVTGDIARLPLTTFISARLGNSTTTTTAPIGQPLQFRQATQTISTTPVFIVVSQRPLVVTQAILDLDNVVGSQVSSVSIRNVRPMPGRPPVRPTVITSITTLQRGWNKIIASGVVDTNDFAKNPEGLNIAQRLNNFIDPVDSVAPDSVRVLLFQGVTDAKRMRIDLRSGDSLGIFRYGQGRFITLPAQPLIFDLTSFDNDDVIGSFSAPLNQFGGERISIVSSGFVEPSRNSSGQPIGLILVPEMPSTTNQVRLLPAAPPLAGVAETTLQAINVSADPAFTNVGVAMRFPLDAQTGVFLPVARSLRFPSADTALTGLGVFVPLLKDIAGVPLTLYATRSRATTINNNNLYYTQEGFNVIRGANVLLLSGLLNPLDFAPNPESRLTKVRYQHFVDSRRIIPPDTVRLLLYHGSTDAPRVDIIPRGGTQKLATLSMGEGAWVDVPVGDYTLDVIATERRTVLGTFSAPLQRWAVGGQRMTIAATGFVNQQVSQWLPPLGLYAVSNTSSRVVATTNIISAATRVAPPFTNAISATGTTISTSSFVITTSGNGETVSTVTVMQNIFVPNPPSAGVRPGTFFPTSQLTLSTTTLTITTTVNASFTSVVIETNLQLYDGTIESSTVSTTQIFATTSTLNVSQMLERLPQPQATAGVSGGETSSVITSLSVSPNPAGAQTQVTYSLSEPSSVQVKLYDALGQEVRTLEGETYKQAGQYSLEAQVQSLQQGMYELRIQTPVATKAVKFLITQF